MTIAIQVENLSKKYWLYHGERPRYQTLRDWIAGVIRRTSRPKPEEFWALQDVSLNLQQGEKIGIIGRNGAGKSTLLKILSKITEPTRGKVTLKGRVASLLEVGTGFHPELTGRENIFLNGAILGMSKAEIKRSFDAIVDFAEIAAFLDTPVKRYSSGMYVRLAFAVAAHLQSEILIVDEVLAVGDFQFQKKCLGKMSDLSRDQGRTLLFVSHNMAAIKYLCNTGLYLHKGKTKFLGSADEAVAKYSQEGILQSNQDIAQMPRDPGLPLWAKIMEITLINDNAIQPPLINSKKPLTVRFHIHSDQDTAAKISLGIRIQDSIQCLIWCHSLYEGKLFALKKGMNYFECTFDPLRLTGGNYYLKCWIYSAIEQATIDYLEDAVHFMVYDIDPFDTGFPLTQTGCIYDVPYSWQIIDQAPCS